MNILTCDPSFYQIDYEINPWMSLEKKVNQELANQQWQNLISILESLNVNVLRMPPADKLPDIVFTANAGILIENNILLSNFKYKERIPEKQLYKNWFLSNNCKTFELPENLRFEGAGDCLIKDRYIFMGYGFRSDEEAYDHEIWQSLLDYHVKCIRLNLVDPYFYHLDTCFCPLNNKQILIYPKAFDDDKISFLRSKFELLEVAQEDALKFACNAVLIENNIVIPAGCSSTKELLESRGYKVHETNMSEFIKAGGACKCLTMVI
jgi:N-dimethylarginine dimethylaminohydrolase